MFEFLKANRNGRQVYKEISGVFFVCYIESYIFAHTFLHKEV